MEAWRPVVVEITETCEKTAKYEKSQKIRRLRKNTCAGDQASLDAYLLKYASYVLRLNQRLAR
jgi:acyl-CoA thioesterase